MRTRQVLKMPSNKKENWASLGLIANCIVWGTTFPLAKLFLTRIDPIMMVFYRFLVATLLLGIYLIIKREKLFANFRYGLILGVLLSVTFLTQMFGLRYTTASNSAFITNLFVVFIPLLSFFIWKKPPTLARGLAIILAMSGLWLLTGGVTQMNLGDLVTVGTAFSCSFHILFSDVYMKKGLNAWVVSFQQFLVVMILSFLYVVFTKVPFAIADQPTFWIILYLGVIATLVVLTIQLVAQKYVNPIKAALIFILEPVFATILALAWGLETFGMQKALGGALILTAMLVSELPLGKILMRTGSQAA